MEQPLNIRFGCRCPVGGCSKPKQILGAQKNKKVGYFSERRARQSVYDHLTGSPWHKDNISHEEACELADTAEVETWEVSLSDTEGDPREGHGGSSEEETSASKAASAAKPDLEKKRKMESENVWYDKPECAPRPSDAQCSKTLLLLLPQMRQALQQTRS